MSSLLGPPVQMSVIQCNSYAIKIYFLTFTFETLLQTVDA